MTKTILLADDSPEDEFLFARVLKIARLENPLFVVRDGAEALAYLKGEGCYSNRENYPLPSVFFLDLNMPRMNGLEVLRWMKTQPQLKDIKVIMLSSGGQPEQVDEAYAMGAASFLNKPFVKSDLDNLTRFSPGYWIYTPADDPKKAGPKLSIEDITNDKDLGSGI